MIFQSTITIPKATVKATPLIQTIYIARGIVTKFMIRPRPGHAGLAHLIILHHEHQVVPSTENMELHGDTFPIDWEDYLEISQPPYELKLVGWNDDDTYPHAFDVHVVVLPKKAVSSLSLADSVKGLFSAMSPRHIFMGES